ncbi:MAG: alpha/beta fold hydrolase [Pseudomonadota bacterium]|nr:alpha/beta fold hydrolase [Pseudomonadota bacterium]
MQMKASDGTMLGVVEDGDPNGAPLVFANPLGTDLSFWDAQIATFADRRVIRYDHAGTGRSGLRAAAASIGRAAQDVIDILDALSLPRADFVGLSLGGMVGMELGATHGSRIGKLVLANTTPHIPLTDMWNGRIAQARADGLADIAAPTLSRWLPDGFPDEMPDTYRTLVDMFLATPVEGYVACCTILRDTDQRGKLARIANETLVIYGDKDVASPLDVARGMAEAIPNARLQAIADAAHLANVEQPAEFNAVVADFLGTPN